MKKTKLFSTTILMLAGILLFIGCRKDLLNQTPSGELDSEVFWKTEADAQYALNGAYAAVRPCFDRDYYFEGQAEYTRVRGTSTTAGNLSRGDAYNGGDYNPSGYGDNFDKYFRYLFGGVARTNYVISNINRMIAEGASVSVPALERAIAEASVLRALCYFRLITMFGDVPYYTFEVKADEQVSSLSRLPIKQVKDSILADLDFAISKLPNTATLGKITKPGALALRGKVNLYWASWNNFGWPELENFEPSAAEATAAYTAAAADFKSVISDFGLALYANGAPGEIDDLGKADKLPNYYHMFNPKANLTNETLLVFTHGGTGTGQGEELMRDFSGRSHEGSQCWVSPRYELADRYQLISTGDFAPPLIPKNPSTDNTARTALNSAVNPQSYVGRDYRMKATLQWDYEMSIGLVSLQSTGMCPFLYRTWAGNVNIGGTNYVTYNTDGTNSGYVFRKFVRNYAGQGRSDGDLAWPVIRLADVYLMYAEATNEISGPQADAIDLVNKIRARGALPALAAEKTADKTVFFNAIEQERIIELVAEGHRGFDLRRWRAIERVWGGPGSPGVWRIDTWGAQNTRYFQNMNDREYQQCYIFRIPPGERDRNPNLTQNIPFR